jgi:ABC-type polysaccharide/polyol phosphate export permease
MLAYVQAVWRCRWFWLNLVKMDLRTRYRRSLLGMGWSLLHPLAMTVILCVVFQKLVMPDDDGRQYAPFLLSGLALWSYVLTSTLMGCQCLYQGEPYIRQYPAPIAIYPLRTTLGATIHFLIALALVLGLSWVLNGPGNLPALLTLPFTLLLLFVFVWSLALLVGFANVWFQDTQHLCEVGFQVVFYITPVLYPATLLRDRGLSWLADYNPLAVFLELIRRPVLHAEFPDVRLYALAGLTVLAVFGLAITTLVRCQRKLIFHL